MIRLVRKPWVWFALPVSVAASLLVGAPAVGAQPGTVESHQQISSTEGGLGENVYRDRFGTSIAALGDLDGDGVDDIAVGAYMDDDGGAGPADRGAVWILFMNTNGTVKAHQKISSTEGGFSGILDDRDYFGRAVDSLGDLDGDGVVDIAVGAHEDDDVGTGAGNRGAVWILFLNTDGTVKAHQKISQTEGGFTRRMTPGSHFGWALAGVPDLNGDGIQDLVVGAPNDNRGHGAVWVLFLNRDGTINGHQKISATEGGVSGVGEDEAFGYSLASLGDFDGDGVPDLAVGAPKDGDLFQGAVWLLFLNADGTVKAHQKISVDEGGFTGPLAADDGFGGDVELLGDLNGDGFPDIAVGAPKDDDGSPDGGNFGAVWILFLNADGTVSRHEKISATSGGFSGSLGNRDYFGTAVTVIGDLNQDGVNELAIGAHSDPNISVDRAAVWVLFMDGVAAISCTALANPVVIPASGGSFRYDLVLTNNADVALEFDLWLEVEGPGVSRLRGPTRRTLAAGGSLSYTQREIVPATDPEGAYQLTCHVGESMPVSEDQAAVLWTKLPPALDAAPAPTTFLTPSESEVEPGIVWDPIYPNPFNPETTFRFSVGESQRLSVVLLDVLGREVGTLYNGQTEAGVPQTIRLDGRNLPSGTYIVRLNGERFSESRRVTLQR